MGNEELKIHTSYLTEDKPQNENNIFPKSVNLTTDQIVRLYYKIEHLILKNLPIPNELYKKLEELKELNTIYKKVLGIANPESINLPKDFIEEYSNLMKRVKKLIDETYCLIADLTESEITGLFLKESRTRLQTLLVLQEHYKNALELGY